MNDIYLLLGTNLGDRRKNLHEAKRFLCDKNIRVKACSSIYETEPWGSNHQPWFLNEVIQTDTSLSPNALLEACVNVERDMGRVRDKKWGPRIIDIDILYYKNEHVHEDHLVIPHPRIPLRRFTLVPLAELAAGGIHPLLGKSQTELLKACPDNLRVKKWNMHR